MKKLSLASVLRERENHMRGQSNVPMAHLVLFLLYVSPDGLHRNRLIEFYYKFSQRLSDLKKLNNGKRVHKIQDDIYTITPSGRNLAIDLFRSDSRKPRSLKKPQKIQKPKGRLSFISNLFNHEKV